MKITLIQGSPKRTGNTAALLNHLSSVLGHTHTVETFHITDYHIEGCRGCATCQTVTNAPNCPIQDDAETLLQKIIDADVVIYGSPLYGHAFSGQLKCFLDRHVSLFKFLEGENLSVDHMTIHSLIAEKPLGLIVSCQGPIENNTELIQMQFDVFCKSARAHSLGAHIFPFETRGLSNANAIAEQINDLNFD